MKEGLPIPPEENFLGEGTEKRVYVDPSNPERVIALDKYETKISPNAIKGRYYLGKILHLLFPDNLADVHMSTSDPIATVRQNLDLEDEYVTLQKMRFGERKAGENIKVKNFTARTFERIENLPEEERVELIKQLSGLGILVEKGFINFAMGKDDNLKYVEIAEPFHDGNRLYDPEKLRGAIDRLGDVEKMEANSYLDRLETLYEDEAKDKK
jgi:hypothetical protein